MIGIIIIAAVMLALTLLIQYWVIKAAVRNGIQEAREDILEDQKNGIT